MSESEIFEILRAHIWGAAMMAMPILVTTLVLGFVIGLLQALTTAVEDLLLEVGGIGVQRLQHAGKALSAVGPKLECGRAQAKPAPTRRARRPVRMLGGQAVDLSLESRARVEGVGLA